MTILTLLVAAQSVQADGILAVIVVAFVVGCLAAVALFGKGPADE